MIVARTPLRMSFMGGGSDRPEYIDACGPGRVVSAALSVYVYASAATRLVQNGFRVAGSHLEDREFAEDISHDLVREAIRMTGTRGAVELHTIAQLPLRGAGLGGSSATAISLLHALHALRDEKTTRNELAAKACALEIDVLGQRIGRQDQWACALGGVNVLRFHADTSVTYDRVALWREQQRTLERHLLFIYGPPRPGWASLVLESQTDWDAVRALAGLVPRMTIALEQADMPAVGRLLSESWHVKRGLSPGVSVLGVDAAYEQAMAEGAYGGKLCGAGGGGTLAMIVPPDRHEAVSQAVAPLRTFHAGVDTRGSVIVYGR